MRPRGRRMPDARQPRKAQGRVPQEDQEREVERVIRLRDQGDSRKARGGDHGRNGTAGTRRAGRTFQASRAHGAGAFRQHTEGRLMAFEPKDMTFSLFPNKDKKTDKHPNLTGTAIINGAAYFIDGWTN